MAVRLTPQQSLIRDTVERVTLNVEGVATDEPNRSAYIGATIVMSLVRGVISEIYQDKPPDMLGQTVKELNEYLSRLKKSLVPIRDDLNESAKAIGSVPIKVGEWSGRTAHDLVANVGKSLLTPLELATVKSIDPDTGEEIWVLDMTANLQIMLYKTQALPKFNESHLDEIDERVTLEFEETVKRKGLRGGGKDSGASGGANSESTSVEPVQNNGGKNRENATTPWFHRNRTRAMHSTPLRSTRYIDNPSLPPS